MVFPSANALRAFDAAARLGSFKKAASELGVTPTAVSHQIKALEDQLGIALFVRGTRKVNLTDAGQILLTATGPAFRNIGEALEEIGGESRTLRLTTTPAFAALWLIPKIRMFEETHKDIQVHVDTSVHQVDLDRDRRIDLAIRYGVAEPAGLTPLSVREEIGAFAAPQIAENLSGLGEASLLETKWQSKALPHITWSDWMSLRGTSLLADQEIRQFDEGQHVISAALAGQGIALVSALLVADLVARGWLVPVHPETRLKGLSYFAVSPPSRREVRKVRAFLNWLKRELGGPS